MIYDNIILKYLHNLDKVCNILALPYSYRYKDDIIEITLYNKSFSISTKDDKVFVEANIRKCLYEVCVGVKWTIELLLQDEFLYTTLDTLPQVTNKLYKHLFIEELRCKCNRVTSKGGCTFKLIMNSGLTYALYEVYDGTADIYFENNLIGSNIRYEEVYNTICSLTNERGKTVSDLVLLFIRQLKMIDWVDEIYDVNNSITNIISDNRGTITLMRLDSHQYIIMSTYIPPTLLTQTNFDSIKSDILSLKRRTKVTNKHKKESLFRILSHILGEEYELNGNTIQSQDGKVYTMVGDVLSTPYASYKIDDTYKAFLQAIRYILIQRRRGGIKL